MRIKYGCGCGCGSGCASVSDRESGKGGGEEAGVIPSHALHLQLAVHGTYRGAGGVLELAVGGRGGEASTRGQAGREDGGGGKLNRAGIIH